MTEQAVSSRYDGLEGLRALMASWVVFGHVGNFLGFYLGFNAPPWMKLVLLTSVPVNVFIALSGFVVFEMLRRRPVAYAQYIRSRAARILPIYFVALALAIFLSQFRSDVLMSQPWRSAADLVAISQRTAEVDADFFAHLVAHATLLHGLVPESLLAHASQSLLAPAWSLSLEWQFYLVAPAIFFIVIRWKWGLLAVALAFLVMQFFGLACLPGLTNAIIINSWGYFFLGWACSRLLAMHGAGFDVKNGVAAIFFAMPLVLASVLIGDPDVRAVALSICIWLVAFGGACWPPAKKAGVRVVQVFVDRCLSMAWLRKIGESSYSLYLLHVLVLDLVGWLLIRGGLLNGGDLRNYMLLLAAVLPLSFITAMIGYRFIERPGMALGRGAAANKSRGA